MIVTKICKFRIGLDRDETSTFNYVEIEFKTPVCKSGKDYVIFDFHKAGVFNADNVSTKICIYVEDYCHLLHQISAVAYQEVSGHTENRLVQEIFYDIFINNKPDTINIGHNQFVDNPLKSYGEFFSRF